MADQHTINHNDAFTFTGALHNNPHYEAVVKERDKLIDNVRITKVPWVQYQRANIPHLTRHSN